MLGMSKANGADTRPGRSGFRPRHWAQAQAENPLARFIPFSSLVSPHDVITRGGDYLRVWRLDGVAFECADEHQPASAMRVQRGRELTSFSHLEIKRLRSALAPYLA